MAKSKQAPRQPRLVRIVRSRPRLFLSIVVGLVAAALAPFVPGDARLVARIIASWDIGVALYLVLAFALFAKADPAAIRRHAAQQDEGGAAILVLTAIAALASLGAIIFELIASGKDGRGPWHLGLAILTIALSWAFTHTIFALHYAHEFYARNKHKGGGLTFPGDEEPDYWDFLYFSLVIGMTSQVSDVAVTAKPIRRIVLAHGTVSFAFNATLLALAVNIAASAL
jgi:uncharacterized membrane protein